MRRRHFCLLILLPTLLVAVWPHAAFARGATAADAEACNLTADELEVYSTTIQELLLKDHEDTARVILREKTSVGYPPGMAAMKSTKENEREVLDSTSVEIRDDFDKKNKAQCKLDPQIQPVDKIQFITFVEEQVNLPRANWKAFYKKYPGATGYTMLSRIGFNSGRNEALIYLGNSCELLCGHGYLVLLRKHKGQWKVWKQGTIWVASQNPAD